MKQITGAQAIMESLLQEDVEVIFGYPGGQIMPTYDALYDYHEKLRHILVRHEQGAAHAAEGYAWVTGKPGVCLVTSGPGATNLVTGIADAMMDSVPMVCITGQIPASLLGSDAFQEADIIGITAPITKWSYQITSASEIPEVFAKAFYIATHGRPGPVLIDITKNAQVESCEFSYERIEKIAGYQPTIIPHARQIELAAELINAAKRPYLFIGHGVLISNAEKEVLQFVEKTGMPVASTLLGLSAVSVDHPQYVGMLGMHGNYGASVLTNKADVILAIGMRFDDRVTGRLSDYAKDAKIIHMDIDPAELNKNIPTSIPIVADAKNGLEALIKQVKKTNHKEWLKEFRVYDTLEKEKVTNLEIHPKDGHVTMAEVIHLLSEKTDGKAVIVSDVGQNQMISAKYYRFQNPRSYITSGGAGTMGFGLPAAFGAKIGAPERDVIAVLGDGGFQMTIQELATIAQEETPVKILVLNNTYLGMVRQWQQLFFQKRYSFVHLKNPDFIAIAKGFGIHAEKVRERKELSKALDDFIKAKESRLLEVCVKEEGNVFPMVPAGASVEEVILE
jgi:acetolactate synthase I/II/III large subunit